MSGLWGKLGCRQKFKMKYKWEIRSASPDWHLQKKVALDSEGTPAARGRNIYISRENCSCVHLHMDLVVRIPPLLCLCLPAWLWAPCHGNFGCCSLGQQSIQIWTQSESQVQNRSNIYFWWVRDLSPSPDVATRGDRHSIHRVATFPWQ